MRLERLTSALDGARLARSVVDPAGNVLLGAGVRLTGRYIQRLIARGVVSVHVADAEVEEAVPDEADRAATRADLMRIARAAFARAAERRRAAGPDAGPAVLQAVVDQVWHRHGLSVDLAELRRASGYAFRHAVQCAVAAVRVGQALALGRRGLTLLGVGVLLQDIGILPYAALMQEPRPLRPEELARLQRHTAEGFLYLRDQAGLDPLSAQVALQHHERLDGSGYPKGLAGKEIHLFGRIAAAADVFDALTADRPFQAGMPPEEAMGILRRFSGEKLDPEVVRRLSEALGVFAPGTPVLLESGEVGIVTAGHGSDPRAPVVQMVLDARRRPTEGALFDLGREPPGRGVRQVLAEVPPAAGGRADRGASGPGEG